MVSAATAVKVHIVFVEAVIAGLRPRTVDGLALNLNLPDSAFPLATDLVRDFDKVQYILLCRVSTMQMLNEVHNVRIGGTPSRRRSHPSPRTSSPWNQ